MIVGGEGSGLDADMLDSLDAAAFADTAHLHDDRYYAKDSLATPGSLNDPANPVDWTRLKNVPDGFADGTDDGGGGGDNHSLDADDGESVDALYVDADGHVGIGATSPGEKLEVAGTVHSTSGGFRFPDGTLQTTAAAGVGVGGGWVADSTVVRLEDPQDSVGIGTDSPAERLDVAGTVRMEGFMMPTGAADGYVLTSDATGLGTWQPSAVGDGHSLDAMDGDPVDTLFVDNQGDVGIGPTPFGAHATLHIREDTNDPVELKIQNLDTGPQSVERITFSDENGDLAMISTHDDGALQLAGTLEIMNSRPGGNIHLRTEGQTMAYINKTGIGIGTPVPKKKLHVSAGATGLSYALKLEDSYSTSAAGILFKTGSGIEDRGKGGIVYELTDTWNRGDFHILQNDNTDTTAADLADAAVTVKNDGPVGIGTIDPEATLHVHDPGLGGPGIALTHSGNGSGPGNGLTMSIGTSGLAIISNHEQNDLQFETHGNTAMVLDEYGRLAVGGLTGFNDNFRLNNRTPGAPCYMRVTNASVGHTESDGLLVGIDHLGQAAIYNEENVPLRFGTNDLVRMALTAEGDIGMGTNEPATDLHIHRGGSNSTFALLTNGTTGNTINDGLRIGVNSSGNGFIRQGENGYLSILTDGTERMRVAADGKVGIGEDNPANLLDLKGATPYLRLNTIVAEAALRLSKNDALKWQLGWNEGSGYVYFWGGGGAGTSLVIEDVTGEVGIGTSSPGYLLDVAGVCPASSFPTSSDARFKENVEQVTDALAKLQRIRGVAFDWNERYEALGRSTGHREIGVIAQEVETVFPELVTTWGDDDYRAVDYGRLTGVLTEAVKELKAENDALRARIEALEQAAH
jgi:hypothetical protein